MNAKKQRHFVVMKKNSKGQFRCVGREGGPSDGAWVAYAWVMRRWAEKFAAKHGGEVVEVRGVDIDLTLPSSGEYEHWQIASCAESQYRDVLS